MNCAKIMWCYCSSMQSQKLCMLLNLLSIYLLTTVTSYKLLTNIQIANTNQAKNESINTFPERYTPHKDAGKYNSLSVPIKQMLLRATVTQYRQTSNISRTLVCNSFVDDTDVVGASPVGTAPTTSSFSTGHQVLMDWARTTARRYEKHLKVGIWCILY